MDKTTPAPSASAATIGQLGIGYPSLPTGLGPYASLYCECCEKREPVATIEYTDGGPMNACANCLPELLANGAEVVS